MGGPGWNFFGHGLKEGHGPLLEGDDGFVAVAPTKVVVMGRVRLSVEIRLSIPVPKSIQEGGVRNRCRHEGGGTEFVQDRKRVHARALACGVIVSVGIKVMEEFNLIQGKDLSLILDGLGSRPGGTLFRGFHTCREPPD